SSMMDPIIEEFAAQVSQVRRHAPSIPFISNLTGKPIQAEEAIDPHFWARHLRHTVQFATGLSALLENPHTIVLEVGPGQSLTGLVKQHPHKKAVQTIIPLCRHPKDQQADAYLFKQAIGRLWLEGVPVVWEPAASEDAEQKPKRCIPLPTYPFERKRYWIERATPQSARVAAVSAEQMHGNEEIKTAATPASEQVPWLLIRNIYGTDGRHP